MPKLLVRIMIFFLIFCLVDESASTVRWHKSLTATPEGRHLIFFDQQALSPRVEGILPSFDSTGSARIARETFEAFCDANGKMKENISSIRALLNRPDVVLMVERASVHARKELKSLAELVPEVRTLRGVFLAIAANPKALGAACISLTNDELTRLKKLLSKEELNALQSGHLPPPVAETHPVTTQAVPPKSSAQPVPFTIDSGWQLKNNGTEMIHPSGKRFVMGRQARGPIGAGKIVTLSLDATIGPRVVIETTSLVRKFYVGSIFNDLTPVEVGPTVEENRQHLFDAIKGLVARLRTEDSEALVKLTSVAWPPRGAIIITEEEGKWFFDAPLALADTLSRLLMSPRPIDLVEAHDMSDNEPGSSSEGTTVESAAEFVVSLIKAHQDLPGSGFLVSDRDLERIGDGIQAGFDPTKPSRYFASAYIDKYPAARSWRKAYANIRNIIAGDMTTQEKWVYAVSLAGTRSALDPTKHAKPWSEALLRDSRVNRPFQATPRTPQVEGSIASPSKSKEQEHLIPPEEQRQSLFGAIDGLVARLQTEDPNALRKLTSVCATIVTEIEGIWLYDAPLVLADTLSRLLAYPRPDVVDLEEGGESPTPPSTMETGVEVDLKRSRKLFPRTAEGKKIRSADWIQEQRKKVQEILRLCRPHVSDLRPQTLLAHWKDSQANKDLWAAYNLICKSIREDDPPIYPSWPAAVADAVGEELAPSPKRSEHTLLLPTAEQRQNLFNSIDGLVSRLQREDPQALGRLASKADASGIPPEEQRQSLFDAINGLVLRLQAENPRALAMLVTSAGPIVAVSHPEDYEQRMRIMLVDNYGKYCRNMFKILVSCRVTPQLAEDLAQISFIKAYAHAGTLKDESKIEAWLNGIAINQFRMHLRRERLYQEVAIEALGEGEDHSLLRVFQDVTSLAPDWKLKMENIFYAITHLPPLYRDILLKFTDGHVRNEQIARELGISVAALKSRLLRAREELAKKLGYTPKRRASRRDKDLDAAA